MKKKVTEKERKIGGIQYALIVVILIVLALFALVDVITDFLWFKELGYVSVFFTKLLTMLKIGIPVFLVVSILSYIYLKTLKKRYFAQVDVSYVDAGSEKIINKITAGIALLVGLATSVIFTSSLWFELLRAMNSTDFGIKDPIFKFDISFFVFKLDFLADLSSLLIVFLVVYVAMTLLYYLILVSFRKPGNTNSFETEDEFEDAFEDDRFSGSGFEDGMRNNPFGKTPFGDMFGKVMGGFNAKAARKSPPNNTSANTAIKGILAIAKPQIIIIGSVILLMIAASLFLRQFELLFSSSGTVYGPGYTQIKVVLWIFKILAVLAILGIPALIISVKRGQLKPIIFLPILMVLVTVIGSVASIGVQKLVVTPDELNKEAKYLERNIEFTQYAYDLEEVTVKEFGATNNLTSEDIAKNSPTIDNIRINDYAPAKQFYNQTQSIRPYYTFNDVDIDRYMIDGEYTQTFLAAREIEEAKITDTWLNRHIKYTHGYGIVMSKVNEVTDSGQPKMVIDSIPPQSMADDIDLARPEIYFGELSNNYSIVATDETEFDYPDGDKNKYTEYEGSAGIKLNLANRILFAIKEKSLNILVTSNINSKSKIVINKNIMQRVQKIMPYISYENDPYMVLVGGKLYWIIDAYTSTSKFPYSEPFDKATDTNYIRNSIKVVIDAYNGDTNYYVVDETDPIAMTMQKIYPDLFKDVDEMTPEIKAHLRYPADLLQIQAEIYKRYHMEDTSVFYQNEDIWDIATEIYGTVDEIPMVPNYYILNLPGETEAEFINSIPFTPKGKRNLTGLMMARNDGETYGELVLFQLPKGKVVYGPMQIEAQIGQVSEIASDFKLWESDGTTYTRGNMFVIPVEDSLIYVEPVYLESTNSSIPEVKRVIVAYGERIAYEETLDKALAVMFGEGVSDEDSDSSSEGTEDEDTGTLSKDDLITKTVEAFNKAQEAQKNGDWAAYGEYMNQVSSYLSQLAI